MILAVGSVGSLTTENLALPAWFSAMVMLTSPPEGCMSVTSIHSSRSRWILTAACRTDVE